MARIFDLYIFDIDGTLCNLDETELLPGRKEHLDQLISKGVKLAIATNQGGVGYRAYRKNKQKPFDEYPTEAKVLERIDGILENIGQPVPFKIAFQYFMKWDKSWSPIPRGREDDPFWSTDYRKPNPGMLLDHMLEQRANAGETIYIGDRPEDEAAAQTAGCQFMWAWEFFGDERPEEASDG